MEKEKAGFAHRLRVALRDAGIEASASVLEKKFNSRYDGAPVTAQAISGWLSGRYLPRPDKVRVLAAIVGVDPSLLQYGGKARVHEGRSDWVADMGASDRAMVDAYLALPAARKKLVRDLIEALSAND